MLWLINIINSIMREKNAKNLYFIILIILFSTSTGCTRIVEKDGAYTDEEHEYTETTAQATESTPSKIPE